jgi:hypothetical protein
MHCRKFYLDAIEPLRVSFDSLASDTLHLKEIDEPGGIRRRHVGRLLNSRFQVTPVETAHNMPGIAENRAA